MTTKTGDTTLVELAEAGPREFIHITNTGGSPVYVSYDGSDATIENGTPLIPGVTLQLNNDGSKPIFTKRVTAIGTETWEVKLQGV